MLNCKAYMGMLCKSLQRSGSRGPGHGSGRPAGPGPVYVYTCTCPCWQAKGYIWPIGIWPVATSSSTGPRTDLEIGSASAYWLMWSAARTRSTGSRQVSCQCRGPRARHGPRAGPTSARDRYRLQVRERPKNSRSMDSTYLYLI